MKKKLVVITNQRGYNQIRNFLGRETSNFEVIRRRDVSAIIHAVIHKVFGKSHLILLQSYFSLSIKQPDVVHLWNGFSFGQQSWVTTLEMPDYMGYKTGSISLKIKRHYWKSIYCRKIIFTSEWAKKHTLIAWKKHYDKATYLLIKNKCTILHPPQKTPTNIPTEQSISDVKLLFVGSDFYRKGGLELLLTVDILINQNNLNFELTIISSLNTADYSVKTDLQSHQRALDIIKNNQSITRFSTLPNNEVLAHLRGSHILCFPSYLDIYGYVVLEAMASYTPVITTNQRALSEINNDSIGWILNMPLNDLDTIDRSTVDLRKKNHLLLCNLLEETLVEIANNKDIIDKKAKACYEYVEKSHNYDNHKKILGKIYEEAIT
jgi:glycosyltransferase involved in cell wall biosynthesis